MSDHLIRCLQPCDPFSPTLHRTVRRKAWTSRRLAGNPDINALKARLRGRDLDKGGGLWITCASASAARVLKRWIETHTEEIGRGPLIVRQTHEDVLQVWEWHDNIGAQA